jgi:hypothetical protein
MAVSGEHFKFRAVGIRAREFHNHRLMIAPGEPAHGPGGLHNANLRPRHTFNARHRHQRTRQLTRKFQRRLRKQDRDDGNTD